MSIGDLKISQKLMTVFAVMLATIVILVGTVALVQFAGDRLVGLTTPRIRTGTPRRSSSAPTPQRADA